MIRHLKGDAEQVTSKTSNHQHFGIKTRVATVHEVANQAPPQYKNPLVIGTVLPPNRKIGTSVTQDYIFLFQVQETELNEVTDKNKTS